MMHHYIYILVNMDTSYAGDVPLILLAEEKLKVNFFLNHKKFNHKNHKKFIKKNHKKIFNHKKKIIFISIERNY